MRFVILAVFLILSAGHLGCNSPHSAAGFRLPSDGNAEKGKIAFVAHKCHNCHPVSGASLPQPEVKPAYTIELGREHERQLSDGYIVTSIINPDNQIANYPKEKITFRGHSKMPNFADDLTVRELTDIVAFLQQEKH